MGIDNKLVMSVDIPGRQSQFSHAGEHERNHAMVGYNNVKEAVPEKAEGVDAQ